jgi:hypothetical protein
VARVLWAGMGWAWVGAVKRRSAMSRYVLRMITMIQAGDPAFAMLVRPARLVHVGCEADVHGQPGVHHLRIRLAQGEVASHDETGMPRRYRVARD